MELLLNSWTLFLIYAVPTFSKQVKQKTKLFVIRYLFPWFFQLWNFDLVNVSYYTSDPNMADLALNARRIDRGPYGCSGFIEFKTDLHDNEVRVGVIVQRSLYRSGPYKILPMKVENETLPIIFNIFYKNIIMEDARKCCENCPFFWGVLQGAVDQAACGPKWVHHSQW